MELFYRHLKFCSTWQQRRQIFAVIDHQPGQLESHEHARCEEARLRQESDKPPQIKTVGPIGNSGLIAGDETERGPDTMDGRPIIQPLDEIMGEFFLRAAADRNQDVRRTPLSDQINKMPIFDFSAVLRRKVTIVDLDWKRFASGPTEQSLP